MRLILFIIIVCSTAFICVAQDLIFDLATMDRPITSTEVYRRFANFVKGQSGQVTYTTHMAGYERNGLRVDFMGHRLYLDQKEVRLSSLENSILKYLILNIDRVLSRERIQNNVWGGGEPVSKDDVDIHVGHIRKKLGVYQNRIEFISGRGYRFSS